MRAGSSRPGTEGRSVKTGSLRAAASSAGVSRLRPIGGVASSTRPSESTTSEKDSPFSISAPCVEATEPPLATSAERSWPARAEVLVECVAEIGAHARVGEPPRSGEHDGHRQREIESQANADREVAHDASSRRR